MISIIIGIIIMVVAPVFFSKWIKKKSDRKAFALLCRILGIVLIICGVIGLLT